MAFKSFTTNTYTLKCGAFKIKFFYSFGSTVTNTVTDRLLDLSPLEVPFTTENHTDFRFSKMTVDFRWGDSIAAMLTAIETDGKERDTFAIVYVDESEFWRGLVDFHKITKEKHYYDDGDVLPSIVRIPIYDALVWYMNYEKMLSDYLTPGSGYDFESNFLYQSGEDIHYDTLTNINVCAGLGVTEAAGNIFNAADMTLIDETTVDISGITYLDFLKDFMIFFACYIYNLNGKLNIQPIDGYGTLTVTNSEGKNFEVLPSFGKDYLSLSVDQVPLLTGKGLEDHEGSNTNIDSRKIVHKVNDVFALLGVCKSGVWYYDELLETGTIDSVSVSSVEESGIFDDVDTDTANTFKIGYITDDSANFFETSEFKTVNVGDRIKFGSTDCVIWKVAETRIDFYAASLTAPAVGDTYNIYRGSVDITAGSVWQWKAFALVMQSLERYKNAYYGNKTRYAIEIDDITKDISKKVSYNGENYRISAAAFNFQADKIRLELVKL